LSLLRFSISAQAAGGVVGRARALDNESISRHAALAIHERLAFFSLQEQAFLPLTRPFSLPFIAACSTDSPRLRFRRFNIGRALFLSLHG